MGLWDYYTDNEWKQRDDIRALQLDAELDASNAEVMTRGLKAANRRIDRLELLLEGLLMYLENQGSISQDTLAVIMRELDKADGREDGKISRPEEKG
jgi:hypothetical protein